MDNLLRVAYYTEKYEGSMRVTCYRVNGCDMGIEIRTGEVDKGSFYVETSSIVVFVCYVYLSIKDY